MHEKRVSAARETVRTVPILTRFRVRVANIANELRVFQVSPRRFAAATFKDRQASDNLLQKVMEYILSSRGATALGSRWNPPFLICLPELFSDATILLSLMSNAPEGTLVASGIRGDSSPYGWSRRAEVVALLKRLPTLPGIRLDLPQEIEQWFHDGDPDDPLNVLLIAAREADVVVTIRPKFAPAPTLEISMNPDQHVVAGEWLTLLEVDPPTGEMGAGLTALPLLCSEYFQRHATGMGLREALRVYGGTGFSHRDYLDLIPVLNICRNAPTGTRWPRAFEDVFSDLHAGFDAPGRVAFAVTTLTCPARLPEAADQSGAPTGIAAARRLWSKPEAFRAVAGMGLSVLSNREWSAVPMDEYSDEARLKVRFTNSDAVFLGTLPIEASEGTFELLTYKYRFPRRDPIGRQAVPFVGMTLFREVNGALVQVKSAETPPPEN